MHARWILWGMLSGALSLQAAQQPPVLRDVHFAHTNDVGVGNEVCVVGEHPLLGGGDPRRAVKLAWSAGNVWQGSIALPAGETVTYRYIVRNYQTDAWANPASFTNLTGDHTVDVPAHVPAPWEGKTVLLHSTFAQAFVLYRDLGTGGDWTNAPMFRVGDGRSPGEHLYRVDGIGSVGKEIEFVFNDGAGSWLNAPAPPNDPATLNAPSIPVPYQGLSAPYNFRTHLDVFFVQDQQVFSYRPPPSVSPPRFETRQIGSTVSGIPGRPITIRLPRGYDDNPWKRYPVVYFHDGDAVFFPGIQFGTWDADRIAQYETSQGRMREAILVAIPNGDNYGSTRREEFLPEQDNLIIYFGKADDYLQFLLDNVTPTLDVNYRTLVDPADTMTVGSSLGGLVSDYIGFHRSDRFGTVGIFSPAYWAAPSFLGGRTVTNLPLRRFLYMGTEETSASLADAEVYWRDVHEQWNVFLNAGHPVHRDLVFEGGVGAEHNEPAWSARMVSFFNWALDPWLDPQRLAAEVYPPEIRLADAPGGGTIQIGHEQRRGFTHRLGRTADFGGWTNLPVVTGPADPWDETTTPADLPAGTTAFWRLTLDPP